MNEYYRTKCFFNCKKCANWKDKEYCDTFLGSIPTHGDKCLIKCKNSKEIDVERVESLTREIHCMNYKENKDEQRIRSIR